MLRRPAIFKGRMSARHGAGIDRRRDSTSNQSLSSPSANLSLIRSGLSIEEFSEFQPLFAWEK